MKLMYGLALTLLSRRLLLPPLDYLKVAHLRSRQPIAAARGASISSASPTSA
jgi:hypothetical protein